MTSLERSTWRLTFDKQIGELAEDIYAAKNEVEKARQKQKAEQSKMCCKDCVESPNAPPTATAPRGEPRKLLPGIAFRPAAKWPADLEEVKKSRPRTSRL